MNRTLYYTGDELENRGHHVDYWFSETLGVSCPVQLRRFLVPLAIVARVRRCIAAGQNWDVVEIHEPSAAAYGWNRRSLPPLVVMSFGIEERGRHASLAYMKQKGLPISLKNRFSPLSVVWQAKYAMHVANHILCPNSEDVEHLIGQGIPRQRLTRYHSGVSPEFIRASRELAPAHHRSGLLFLGSWLTRKGILDLIPAVSRALEVCPSEHLTIAGCQAGADEIYLKFHESLRSRIRIIPTIETDADLIRICRDHSVFVLPSYFEGQPLAMIEAAAMGLAIVTTDVCGMRDFVESDRNGILVPVGNPEVLAEKLIRLLQHPDEARRLGNEAQKLALTHTWASSTDRIEAGYVHAAGRG